MKTVILSLMMFAMPLSVFGALSPSMYRKAQNRSSDVLVVKVGRVTKYRYSRNRLFVKARVKVLAIDRASRRIHRGNWITIRYKTVSRLPRGVFGASPTPILRQGHVYRVYLRRRWNSRQYSPVAGARSFTKLY